MEEKTEIVASPPAALVKADDVEPSSAFGKAELESIFQHLVVEAERRFKSKSYIRTMKTGEILDHIEKIIALNKKNPVISPVTINNNLGILQGRVKELDVHPARRKELRVQTRKINNIPR